MPKKKKGPDPEFLIHFRGGPWGGKEHHFLGSPGLTRIRVEADADNDMPGEYVLAESLGPVGGENALAYGFDWVPDEEPTGEDAADATGGEIGSGQGPPAGPTP